MADQTDGELLQRLGTNGQLWAQEFMRLFGERPSAPRPVIDEDLMIGWFANAIEAGRDAKYNYQLERDGAEIKRLQEEVARRQRAETFHFDRANRLSERREALLDLCNHTDAAWVGMTRATNTTASDLGPQIPTSTIRSILDLTEDENKNG